MKFSAVIIFALTALVAAQNEATASMGSSMSLRPLPSVTHSGNSTMETGKPHKGGKGDKGQKNSTKTMSGMSSVAMVSATGTPATVHKNGAESLSNNVANMISIAGMGVAYAIFM